MERELDWPRLGWQSGVRILLMVPLLISSMGAGCDLLGPLGGATDGNVGLDPNLFPGKRIQGEPNDAFSEALDAIFDSQGRAHLAGTISNSSDVDVYALGARNPGDRVIIDVGTPLSSLDSTVAVFDSEGNIVFENDDRNFDLGQYDPFINQVVRHQSGMYYLAISAAPLGQGFTMRGTYDIVVTITSGNAVPATAGQVVLLDFDGGHVVIPDYGTYDIGFFDAADVDPVYAGHTAELRQQIAQKVREDYNGLGLDVRVVPGDPLPTGDYSSIFFGGHSPDAFGVSQDIDSYNANRDDDAVIFTEMFTGDLFSHTLTLDELGIAIGNVAAHEMGHLLGLNHVADVQDLMDTTGGANTLLGNQEFLTGSPLDESVFPIGSQDDVQLLLETIGPG